MNITNEEKSRGQVHGGVGGKASGGSHSKVHVLSLCFSTSLKAQDKATRKRAFFLLGTFRTENKDMGHLSQILQGSRSGN